MRRHAASSSRSAAISRPTSTSPTASRASTVASACRRPLSGWLGHAAPFDFRPEYHPAAGIQRFVCGTPPVLSLAALECGLAVFDLAQGLGGMTALRAKSSALCDLFIE